MKGIAVFAMAAAMTTPAFAKTASIKIAEKEMKLDVSGIAQVMYVGTQGVDGLMSGKTLGIGDYVLSAAGNDTFTLNRLQLSVASQIADKIAMKSSLEFGRNHVGDANVVDAFLDLGYIPGVTLRVGQFALPIGAEIEKSPADLDFINYSVLTTIGAQRNRGIMAYGDIIENVSFDLGIANGPASGGLTGAGDEIGTDAKQYFGRLSVSPMKDLSLALFGGMYKRSAAAATKLKSNEIGLAGSYAYAGFGFEAGLLSQKTTNVMKTKDAYGAVTYTIPQTDVQLVSRYEQVKETAIPTTASLKSKIFTAGLNWNFEKNTRLQIQREFWGSDVNNVNKSDVTMVQLGVTF